MCHTPPPADATASRQSPGEQAGSIAIEVTRPVSSVAGPVSVSGSKNCEASPATLGVNGPSSFHEAVAAACSDAPLPAARCERRDGMPLKALSVFLARWSSTYARG